MWSSRERYLRHCSSSLASNDSLGIGQSGLVSSSLLYYTSQSLAARDSDTSVGHERDFCLGEAAVDTYRFELKMHRTSYK